jgi:PhnB protein
MKAKSKTKAVRAVPEGLYTITPYLVVDNAIDLIEFLKQAFDARETFMHKTQEGKIMHSTVTIGNSTLMITDTMDGMPAQTGMFYLYLENVDDVFQKALNAGGTTVRDVRDEFYGDRAGALKDKWGNVWWIATHMEDVKPDELERRSKEMQDKREHEPHL